ncbi:MAG: peptidylprolyl isomerase [Phycisphaerae bacterium]|nr:peptidylprolyl isomerase [Phycisphaerae bacterium]NIR67454.1 peptidylprolyl isomerase [candidate division Zixibacteria bacterium]NIP51009.1 peptidylprolyl isomerase [Phycisphaerae bacterium]NIS52741.1 peptidylprolyl isomerase [Phycisphaerae bacterium]NIU10178.1 peptidylprolyl isomerase [Phycisphaerae bacterium]
MTQAKSGDTVKIQYTGRLNDNSVFDTSVDRDPIQLTIGQGRTIPALEEAIIGMETGETKTVEISAEQGYGAYQKELVHTVSRKVLPVDMEPEIGQRLKATSMDGRAFSVTIKDISENSITMDANHPLAGKDLKFDIELIAIL